MGTLSCGSYHTAVTRNNQSISIQCSKKRVQSVESSSARSKADSIIVLQFDFCTLSFCSTSSSMAPSEPGSENFQGRPSQCIFPIEKRLKSHGDRALGSHDPKNILSVQNSDRDSQSCPLLKDFAQNRPKSHIFFFKMKFLHEKKVFFVSDFFYVETHP